MSTTTPPSNEPDASPDAVWQQNWEVVSPNWGDWLYNRLPPSLRAYDTNQQLYRFIRIFGRAMNRSHEDMARFTELRDPYKIPPAYLDHAAYTLGVLLPHSVATAQQRRLLSLAVAFYRRKGTSGALEFLTKRYLNITVKVVAVDWTTHSYAVTFNTSTYADGTSIPAYALSALQDELLRILDAFQPAGLVRTVNGVVI